MAPSSPGEILLFDHLTGLEFTGLVGRMYGLARTVARERSRELLALFDLNGEPAKLIGDYSKGMRKRVAMAAARIHRPELFLLDEPFEGVDAVGARLMKEILLDPPRRDHVPWPSSELALRRSKTCSSAW
jgi:ABC-2 type transport system ATP-binding protein